MLPLRIPESIQVPFGSKTSITDLLYRATVKSIYFIPSMGVSTGNSGDDLNVLAVAQYTEVRHFNSGSRNYQASDLFQVELATINVYLYISFLQKIYGIAKLYSYTHRYLPKQLSDALGVDLNDIVLNLRDFGEFINLCIKRAGAFVVPTDFKILSDWYTKVGTIYLDDYDDSKTPQFVQFVPEVFYVYDWENAKLVPTHLTPSATFADLRDFFETMIQDLTNSTDVGIISGDILKAYSNKFYTLPPMSSDYTTPIVRTTNEEMAYLMNFDVVYPYFDDKGAYSATLDSFAISQDEDTGLLICNPYVSKILISMTENMHTILNESPVEDKWVDNFESVIGPFLKHMSTYLGFSFLSNEPSESELLNGYTSKIVIDNHDLDTSHLVYDAAKEIMVLPTHIKRCGPCIVVRVETASNAATFGELEPSVIESASYAVIPVFPGDMYDNAWFDNSSFDEPGDVVFTFYRDMFRVILREDTILNDMASVSRQCRLLMNIDADGDVTLQANTMNHNVPCYNISFVSDLSIDQLLQRYMWNALINDTWLKDKDR